MFALICISFFWIVIAAIIYKHQKIRSWTIVLGASFISACLLTVIAWNIGKQFKIEKKGTQSILTRDGVPPVSFYANKHIAWLIADTDENFLKEMHQYIQATDKEISEVRAGELCLFKDSMNLKGDFSEIHLAAVLPNGDTVVLTGDQNFIDSLCNTNAVESRAIASKAAVSTTVDQLPIPPPSRDRPSDLSEKLFSSVVDGDLKNVQILLNSHADPNTKGSNGEPILVDVVVVMFIIKTAVSGKNSSEPEQYKQICIALISAGAKVDDAVDYFKANSKYTKQAEAISLLESLRPNHELVNIDEIMWSMAGKQTEVLSTDGTVKRVFTYSKISSNQIKEEFQVYLIGKKDESESTVYEKRSDGWYIVGRGRNGEAPTLGPGFKFISSQMSVGDSSKIGDNDVKLLPNFKIGDDKNLSMVFNYGGPCFSLSVTEPVKSTQIYCKNYGLVLDQVGNSIEFMNLNSNTAKK